MLGWAAMVTKEELDALDATELADRAMARAKHHLDAGFLWNLLKMIPAAEAISGDASEAEFDVHSLYQTLHDLRDADEGGPDGLAEALRPVYTAYLLEHDGR